MNKAYLYEEITHYKNSTTVNYPKYDAIIFDKKNIHTNSLPKKFIYTNHDKYKLLRNLFIKHCDKMNNLSNYKNLFFESSLKYSKTFIIFHNGISNEKTGFYMRIALRNQKGILEYDDIPIVCYNGEYFLEEDQMYNTFYNLLDTIQMNSTPQKNDLFPDSEIILSPKAAAYFVHEIIGHLLEFDYASLGTSIYSNKINKLVFPSCVNVYDDPFQANGFSLGKYDDEGNPLRVKQLINKGIINDFVTTKRCDNFYNKPLYRMSNLYLDNDPDNIDLQQMIRYADPNTLIINNLINGWVNPYNGDFILKGKDVEIIKDEYKIQKIQNITLTGNCKDISNNILMIGNDIKFYLGLCIKENQVVLVGSGSPSIKLQNLNLF